MSAVDVGNIFFALCFGRFLTDGPVFDTAGAIGPFCELGVY
ncbi:MAG TPA: hypothetical protein VJV79_13975 [Polyangiaceae bacterium]|nr:hypothetical protein [Polyangiaceae bacterium]